MTGALCAALIVVCGGAGAEQYDIPRKTPEEPVVGQKVQVVGTVKTEPAEVDAGCEGIVDRSSELCAQWEAVDAARDGVDVSILALTNSRHANWIAGIAGVLSFVAMMAALAAAWYSRRTLHAERAWMTPKVPEIEVEYDRDASGKLKNINLTVRFN
ncbi:MAG: hypothetical protein QM667_08705, partial [Asticcacaulis sp.]